LSQDFDGLLGIVHHGAFGELELEIAWLEPRGVQGRANNLHEVLLPKLLR
jgi:hypothetical protein